MAKKLKTKSSKTKTAKKTKAKAEPKAKRTERPVGKTTKVGVIRVAA